MRFIFLKRSLFCALRLGPKRGLCALSAPSAFNNYGVDKEVFGHHIILFLCHRCRGLVCCQFHLGQLALVDVSVNKKTPQT
ncbi:hypothetical protein Hanom_Chr16g01448681 [Helianthus anomalus]